MSGARSRLAAAEILMTALEERRTLDEAMALTRSFGALSGADRGFARAMASAALRQLGQINAGLAPFLNRPLDTATPPSRAFLQIGAAQMWILGTPDHAAVSETVTAAKMWPRARKSAGFLNAVLRKVAADHTAFDEAGATTIWPDWLRLAMTDGLGAETAADMALLQTREPSLHLTCKQGHIANVEAAFEEIGLETERLPGGSLQVPSGAVETFPLYEDGLWWVQDSAAALPAKLLKAGPNEHVADLCAAPGGKTMQLASTGATVTAIDRSGKRLERVKENLERTGLNEKATLITANAEEWKPKAPIDKVLVDAPCSALGTLRRHPEGAWIKQSNDVARYPDVQKRLLRAAIDMLKPGGIAVYCVCSPLPAEGTDIVNAVLKDGLCAREPVAAEDAPGFEQAITPAGDVVTTPTGGMDTDAFYMVRLKKLG